MEEQIGDKDIFINRELSWLDFNRRVLELSREKELPVGERLKFASIYGSNLDEFFMVRVGSLYDRTLLKETAKDNKTGWTPAQQLDAIMPKVRDLQQACDKSVAKLYETLAECGYEKVSFDKLNKKQEQFWKKYFLQEVYPLLSPQIVDRRHPFPFLRNNETYIGAMIREKVGAPMSFGLVPVSNQFQRTVFVPREKGIGFALVEELMAHFAGLIFGKHALQGRCIFRITRNADITVEEGMFDHDVDYRVIMSDLLKKRRKLAPVRLQISPKAPAELVSFLCGKLLLPEKQVFEQTAPLDLSFGFKLAARMAQDGHSEWFYPQRRPMLPPAGFELRKVVEAQDVLLVYPYQSMRPFIQLLRDAAEDPEVLSIKMTLYRVAHESKIIEALLSAAENGKEVVVIVELRARFDEQNNIDYSRQLEEAGCTVIYGFENYKVHSKLTLITKKHEGKLRYLSQIGTGNYNEKTSEQYTDLSFLTTDPTVGMELAKVFHNLAMEQLTEDTEHLLVAPLRFKTLMLKELDREIEQKQMGHEARVILKCNSISDVDIIEKIRDASRAGVRVDMIVRGICCIKAGVPGETENVHIRSIVGRYLEHSRIYAFGVGDDTRVYIASGDFLTRNTQRRVEVGVRVREQRLAAELSEMLQFQLRDNVNAHEMQPDGSYRKVRPAADEARVDSQAGMYARLENAWPVVPRKAPEPARRPVAKRPPIRPVQRAPIAPRRPAPKTKSPQSLLLKTLRDILHK